MLRNVPGCSGTIRIGFIVHCHMDVIVLVVVNSILQSTRHADMYTLVHYLCGLFQQVFRLVAVWERDFVHQTRSSHFILSLSPLCLHAVPQRRHPPVQERLRKFRAHGRCPPPAQGEHAFLFCSGSNSDRMGTFIVGVSRQAA